MALELHCYRKTLCIQDNDCHIYPEDVIDSNPSKNNKNNNYSIVDKDAVVKSEVDDFVAAFDPNEMRCIALVSHNEMKVSRYMFQWVSCHIQSTNIFPQKIHIVSIY